VAFSTVNDIMFRFRSDPKSLEQGTKRARTSMAKTDKASKTLKRAMGALGVAFGAREILRFGKDSIEAAADYTESVNAIQVVSGEGAAAVDAFGRSAAESVGLSRTAVNEAAVAFQGFLEQIDRDGDTSDTFISLATRASDFASVMNIDVNDALAVFSSTLSGQSKPIRAFGIDTSAAAVAAYAAANGIGELGTELSASDKVLATYGLLMEKTAVVEGDFAATSDELQNSQRILNAEFENSKITLGQQLIPAMHTAVSLTSDLITGFEGVGDRWSEGQRKLLPFADDVRDLTGGMVDLAASYRGAGEELFAFGKTMSTVEVKLAAGQDVVQVAGDAMVGLASSGSLSAVAIKNLRAELKLSDKQFKTAADRALWLAKTSGLAAEDLALLEQQARDLGYTFDRELVTSEEDAAEAARDLAWWTKKTGEAHHDAEEDVRSYKDALLEGLDPVSDAIDSYENLQTVLEDVDEDGERTADELLDVAKATLDVAKAFDGLSADDINAAVASLSRALGISESAARDLLRELGLLDGKRIAVEVLMDFVGHIGGRRMTLTATAMAKGGPVAANEPYMVGEEGPELIVPKAAGTVIPNGGGVGPVGYSGGGTVVNITVNALDPDSAAVAVVDAIRSYEDRFGPV